MKFFKILFSGTFMGILLVIFSVSIGYATFIENDFDAIMAKMLVYNARWFEVLMVLMIINFTGMIFSRQLYKRSKINVLIIHVSLVIIIIGAGITRYIGFEGQMHIREGHTTNRFISSDTYLNIQMKDESGLENINKRIWLSPFNNNIFSNEIYFNKSSLQFNIDKFIPNAVEQIIPDEHGIPILSLATAGPHGRDDRNLKYGETAILNNVGISFGDTTNKENIQFIIKNGNLLIKPPSDYREFSMNDSSIVTEQFVPAIKMQVYKISLLKLVVKDFFRKGLISYISNTNTDIQGKRVAKLIVKNEIDSREIFLVWDNWNQVLIDDIKISCKIGNLKWNLPFYLKLNEFQLDRYPGSKSPSSYASEITLIDKKNNIKKPFRIFMNNILNYNGYRFYQSSYDNDEKGTILSVNHDFWGTTVTYIGYFLLFGSLILSLFTRKTRFSRISQKIKEVHLQRKKLPVFILTVILIFSGSLQTKSQEKQQIDKKHAESFGKLLAQNKDGRIIPINTLSNQILVKIYKKNSFDGFTADQVFLGMLSNPNYWKIKPMIKVGSPKLKRMLGIKSNYARFVDFFDKSGNYILTKQIDDAYAKKPALRNLFDKDLIYVDERVNVSYLVYRGSYLSIFPIPEHPNNKWASPDEILKNDNETRLSVSADLYLSYMESLNSSLKSGNYSETFKALQQIKNYQYKEGMELIPSASKTYLEILYNKINLFKNLFPVFMILGLILFGFLFVQIFKPILEFKGIIRVLVRLLIIAFLAQTFGLCLRWYISGHAPWSNGYESMIYISWATMLAGFIFMKKSPIILSVTSLLAGVTLLTAHMSWMNPEITNLVPVLKSYWLTIHVATITASYGFLALGCFTGFLNLCIMIFRNKNNFKRINLIINELTLIIELSLTIGLILLIIGNFLGGIWANESWGRYWGWDPKETWSLVTIIVYSFILHLRLIPGLRNTFSFNLLSMFAFSSVLMTYFGVNYYLSGLHSYASGDPIPVPVFIYYTLAILLFTSFVSFLNELRLGDRKSENYITL
jgi:cytochrome c-type biogenesis protein CcsB